MLDTIRVKFPINPTEEQLKGWIHKTSESQTGIRNSYIYNTLIDEAMLKFTYFPLDYKSKPMLTLEVSLPKLLFDNNYRMITSIDGAITIANTMLDGIPHIPKLDIAEGVLIRLDMCFNHQVGDAVEDYITAISKLDYPHRRTKGHKGEGAEFKAKHATTKFYNKEHESGYAEAHGILRQETTLMSGKDIKKIFKVKQPTLKDITKEKVTEYLKNDLSKLGLLGNSIANRDIALQSLCETFGKKAGIYYFGLFMSKTSKSRKRIVKDSDMHPRSLDRQLRKIVVEAGIPLTWTDREEPLPPLNITL